MTNFKRLRIILKFLKIKWIIETIDLSLKLIGKNSCTILWYIFLSQKNIIVHIPKHNFI